MTGLFAYGTLKKDELAFNQIRNFVDSVKIVRLSDFEIGIRDSLPVIFSAKGSFVMGELLVPKSESAEVFWKTVEDYEGTNLYSKAQVLVRDSDGQEIHCQTFAGKREKARGYSRLDEPSWTSKYDPYLAYSFPLLLDEIQNMAKESYPADMHLNYWRYMNSLQEKYLLLTVILEHIALLVIGTPNATGPTSRIAQLGATQEWEHAFMIVKESSGVTPIQVKDAKKLKDKFVNNSAADAIEMYYQVRSNLSHQGKGGFEDCDLIYSCLVDLAAILRQYLIVKIEGIENVWKYVNRSEF